MAATTFEVLAEPTRRRILDLLLEGARPVGDLVAALGVSQPGVSKHLRVLREAGFVAVRQDAQRRFYEVRPEPLVGGRCVARPLPAAVGRPPRRPRAPPRRDGRTPRQGAGMTPETDITTNPADGILERDGDRQCCVRALGSPTRRPRLGGADRARSELRGWLADADVDLVRGRPRASCAGEHRPGRQRGGRRRARSPRSTRRASLEFDTEPHGAPALGAARGRRRHGGSR